jgi:hypothetical protein
MFVKNKFVFIGKHRFSWKTVIFEVGKQLSPLLLHKDSAKQKDSKW